MPFKSPSALGTSPNHPNDMSPFVLRNLNQITYFLILCLSGAQYEMSMKSSPVNPEYGSQSESDSLELD